MNQRIKVPVGLERILGHTFAQPELLRQAMTHASVASNRAERIQSNERLEFLGDRVLGLIVAQLLFDQYTNEDEGHLARRFAALVGRESLARVALDIGLSQYMTISDGEADSGGRENPTLLADTCEAVIAALYLDGGLEAASAFVDSHWRVMMSAYESPPKDAKTALQEWAQGRGLCLPIYREISREGPPHAPQFTIKVSLPDLSPAIGYGNSKRAAEQVAAETLLQQVGNDER